MDSTPTCKINLTSVCTFCSVFFVYLLCIPAFALSIYSTVRVNELGGDTFSLSSIHGSRWDIDEYPGLVAKEDGSFEAEYSTFHSLKSIVVETYGTRLFRMQIKRDSTDKLPVNVIGDPGDEYFFCVLRREGVSGFDCTDGDEPVHIGGEIEGKNMHLSYTESGSKSHKNELGVDVGGNPLSVYSFVATRA